MQSVQFEREVLRELPTIVGQLLDLPAPTLARPGDGEANIVLEAAGRRWAVEARTSSGPAVVARVADRLAARATDEAIGLLVVPYMTAAGARAAADGGVNWIDLSGNASLRDGDLFVSVSGRPNRFATPGRPSSPFAPKSSRLTRALLLDPERWWIQQELARQTGLNPGQVSRVVRRLDVEELLERDGSHLRPRAPDELLDAWADDYRFDRHDIVAGHVSGSGSGLARDLHERLDAAQIDHAFTGLPAAWALDGFARFRLVTVYVTGDPRGAADAVGARRNEAGANLQLVGPDDPGVFDGAREVDGLPCVSAVQAFLDLRHLPERAQEAAEHLRAAGRLWRGGA